MAVDLLQTEFVNGGEMSKLTEEQQAKVFPQGKYNIPDRFRILVHQRADTSQFKDSSILCMLLHAVGAETPGTVYML